MYIVILIVFLVLIFVGYITVSTLFKSGKRRINEAMKLEANGKHHEALALYDMLLKSGSSPSEIRWRIANNAMKVTLYPRAEKELQVLIQTKDFPQNVSLYAVKSLLAECYMKQGKVKEAFIEYLELSKIANDNYHILFELAKIYAGQRMVRNAITLFEKCFKHNPANQEVIYYLARAYLDYGEPIKAAEYFEKAAALKFLDHGKVNYYLGVLYYSQKKFNFAMQNFTQVIKLRPNDNRILSETYNLVALCYKERGLIDEAITNFEKSQTYSDLLPEDEGFGKNTLYNQGVLLYKGGHFKEALEKFYKLKMIDYKYKDIDSIIKIISGKMKNGEKLDQNMPLLHISDNPLISILKKGLLHSKVRFNINVLQAEVEKMIGKTAVTESSPAVSYTSVTNFNEMDSKSFKDLARKIVRSSGFLIKSEPRFFQDTDYIDGDAITFIGELIKSEPKLKHDILITVRRYKDEVPELSVSKFFEWIEEKNVTQGIFITSGIFSTASLRLVNINPKVKFIDKNGLARMLGRIG